MSPLPATKRTPMKLFGLLPARPTAILFSASLIASSLSTLSNLARGTTVDGEGLDDEGLLSSGAAQFGLIIVRGWSVFGGLVGAAGLYGVSKNAPRLLRFLFLHSGTTLLALSAVLFTFACLSATPTFETFGHAICSDFTRGELSGSSTSVYRGALEGDWLSLGYIFGGWGLEGCEERLEWMFWSATSLGLLVMVIKIHVTLVLWQYYTLARRNGLPLRREKERSNSRSSRSPGSGDRRRAGSVEKEKRRLSIDTVKGEANKATIMLLPPSYTSTSTSPIDSLTSPNLHDTPDERRRSRRRSSTSASGVIVYAPVMMSREEALRLGGKEIFRSPQSPADTPGKGKQAERAEEQAVYPPSILVDDSPLDLSGEARWGLDLGAVKGVTM